jgi:hypothetical protein
MDDPKILFGSFWLHLRGFNFSVVLFDHWDHACPSSAFMSRRQMVLTFSPPMGWGVSFCNLIQSTPSQGSRLPTRPTISRDTAGGSYPCHPPPPWPHLRHIEEGWIRLSCLHVARVIPWLE